MAKNLQNMNTRALLEIALLEIALLEITRVAQRLWGCFLEVLWVLDARLLESSYDILRWIK
jgi:hypothetical protein